MAGYLRVCAVAALLVAANGSALASEEKVSPIEKVLQMLVELQENVISEGRKEAKTYDKFACFCKDAAEEKSESITDRQTEVDDLVGKITKLNSDRNVCDDKLSELNKEIGAINQEMAEANKRNLEAKTEFEAARKEVADAEYGIHQATDFIKKGASGDLALAQGAKMPKVMLKQLRKTAKDVKAATRLADHLGLWEPEHHKLLSAFAQFEQHQPEVPMEDSFQAHGELDAQLGTMTNLENDFHGNVLQKDANEKKRVQAFQGFMQQKFDETKAKEKQSGKQEVLKTKKIGEIGARTKELSETQATLHDDQNYLKDLIQKCNAKSDEWDQRTNMRKAELAALTTAIDIISKRVAVQAGKTSMKRFLQLSAAADEAAPEDIAPARRIGRSHEKEPRAGIQLSFSHLVSPKKQLGLIAKVSKAPGGDDGKYDFAPVLALLRSKGKQLKSTMLLKLAEKVEADPFAKIKQLIQELIGRLGQEAADEATHKGWCDKELAKATVMRDDKASAVRQLNSLLDAHQANAQKLSDDIEALETQISDLEDTQEKFTGAREEEKAENEKNIKEAEDGLVAINDALKVLKDFYGAAAEGGEAPSMLQDQHKDPAEADDMPDSGFEGENTGSQEAASGILGMMDVIVSDFERTIRVTGEEEEEAARDFTELNRKTQISIDTKNEGKNSKESELTETRSKISEELDDLKNQQGILDKAIQELLELQPACIDTGMSYEERVAKREQELESLKQALCLLEREGPVKEESMSANC